MYRVPWLVTAVGADVARGEDLVIAMRADFADQPVALFLESPVSRDFHFVPIPFEIFAQVAIKSKLV